MHINYNWFNYMPYDPRIHHRQSIRLKGYDYYQPGVYFITIVSKDRENLLGEIVNGEVHLSEWGQIAASTWEDLVNHNPGVGLDAYVVMPNHLHGIVIIKELNPISSLPEIIRQFKTYSARRINQKRRMAGIAVWQRNYYDHIIRNQNDLERVRQYIQNNPQQWCDDAENPTNRKFPSS
jgi:REP element-mobilizing transposase RayT